MSRGLGQGELVDVPPARTMIVPVGHGAVWGVDPSSVRVAIASVAADGARGVSMRAFPGRPGAERLIGVRAGVRALVQELVGVEERPGLIVLEQPFGSKPNPQMAFAVGVTMEALALYGEAPIVLVTPGQWKAVACGSGAIRKPQRVRGEPKPAVDSYAVLRWARTLGYAGDSWDCADAMGIAEWGRRTFRLEQR